MTLLSRLTSEFTGVTIGGVTEPAAQDSDPANNAALRNVALDPFGTP